MQDVYGVPGHPHAEQVAHHAAAASDDPAEPANPADVSRTADARAVLVVDVLARDDLGILRDHLDGPALVLKPERHVLAVVGDGPPVLALRAPVLLVVVVIDVQLLDLVAVVDARSAACGRHQRRVGLRGTLEFHARARGTRGLSGLRGADRTCAFHRLRLALGPREHEDRHQQESKPRHPGANDQPVCVVHLPPPRFSPSRTAPATC